MTCRTRRDERGSATVELVITAPVLLMIMLLVVGLARMASAAQEVDSIAADGARAASLERDTSLSADAARAAVTASLGDRGLDCAGLDVDVDVSAYQPGGVVTVTVACTADLRDIALTGLPGTWQITSTAHVPIETHRSS